MANLSDVAAAAGVSVSAVSRVLANSPSSRVSKQTRERILAAADALDYRPNFAARALKSSRTHVLGLIIPDITNPIFHDLLRGVEAEADRRGYVMLLARSESMGDSDAVIRKLVGEGRVDGVLLQIDDRAMIDGVPPLHTAGLPLVFLNSVQEGGSGSVTFDDEQAAILATEHLLALGHRRIGFIGGRRSTYTSIRRHGGYVRAMSEAEVAIDEVAVSWLGYTPSEGASALAQIMSLPEPPTALVVANINASLGAMLEARRHGLRIPEDLSIVAIHDSSIAEVSWPPLTTVRMPWQTLGRYAVQALIHQIEHGTAQQIQVREPEPELIVRESTAPRTIETLR
ncbi:MAG: LacI family DNA-binding transcriptional regulator [Beutenbergiaceae bacterium]